MKVIVTHVSPDWDAIGSVWIIKKFFPGWQDANVQFVPAGSRVGNVKGEDVKDPIEIIGDDEVLQVDTGMGPLDHHQTSDRDVCGMSRTMDYVLDFLEKNGQHLTQEHKESLQRIVKVVVEIDHFREVFWADPASDQYEFSLIGVLEGLKYAKPGQDSYYVVFGMECLDALFHEFESRIWAEKEIKEKGIEFETSKGGALGVETMNEQVLKLGQKMGYVLVVKKDPRRGNVAIKTLPETPDNPGIDLTSAHDQLSKMDPEATWYLHVSKKMLLNGSSKNPKMKPTKLKLTDIIKVLERI